MRRLLLLLLSLPFLLHGQTEAAFQKAENLAAEGDRYGAVRQLEQLIADFPKREYDCSVAYLRISELQQEMGDFTAALEANERSKALRDELRADDTADNFFRYGEIYRAMGQYERALFYYEKARDLPFLFPELFARVNAGMGEAFLAMELHDEAVAYYRKAINLLEIEFGADDPFLFSYYEHGARVALAAGDPDLAAAYLRRAEAIRTDPVVYYLLGECAAAEESTVEARDQWLRAHRYFSADIQASRRDKAQTELALARLNAGEGDRQAACSFLQMAIRTLCPRFSGEDFLENPPDGALVLDPLLLVEALGVKIDWLSATGAVDSLTAALEAARYGVNVLDDFLAFGDQSQLNWRRATRVAHPFFTAAIKAGQRAYRRTGDEAHLRRAFEWGERGRHWALRLYQLLLLQQSRFGEPLREDWKVRRWLQEATQELARDPENQRLWIDVKQRQRLLDERIARYREAAPELYRWLYDRSIPRNRDLPALLQEDELLLAYYVGTDQTFIFTQRAENLSLHVAPVGAAALAALVDSVRFGLARRREEMLVAHAATLSEALLAPVGRDLKRADRVLVVPHGPLYALPFALLPGKAPRGRRINHRQLDYLGVEKTLLTVPSLTAWSNWLQNETPRQDKTLAILTVDPEAAAVPADWRFVFDTLYQRNARSLRVLSRDGQRLETFKRDTLSVDQAVLISGAQAEDWEAAMAKHTYLHLRAPAFVDATTPVFSGLLLHRQRKKKELMEPLFSEGFYGLPLGGRHLVLDGFTGETADWGLAGSWPALATPLLQAGARSVMISWFDDPRDQSRFWARYYQLLPEQPSEAAALQTLRAEWVRRPETAAPWYWGGGVISGGG